MNSFSQIPMTCCMHQRMSAGVLRRGNPFAPLFLMLAALVLSLPMSAQTASSTEGFLTGTVTDSSGAYVPGAKVTLSSEALIAPKATTTDTVGSYRFPALSAGDYTLTVQASGMGTQTRPGIHISLGFTATVNVQMAVGSVMQTVEVSSAASTIDLDSNNITTNLETEQLKELPGSRDLWAVLSQAPAIAETKMDVGGSDALTQQGYTVYGLGTSGVGGGGINRGEVEGIMVNEGSGGGGSEMFYVDYAAMQTVSVNTANNTAEMPQPGVLSQMVFKSGGNSYHGDLDFEFENAALEGHDIDSTQIAALTAGGVIPTAAVPFTAMNRLNLFRDISGDLGGFLKKDRLWWFGAYRYTTTEQNYPTLNETQLSWSPNYTGKVSYILNKNQKLVGFYTHSNKLQPDYLNAIVLSGGRQGGALETAATAWSSSYPVYVYGLQYTYTITNNLYLEAEAGNYFSGWTRRGKSNLPRIEDTTTNYVSGGQSNIESDRHRPQARASVSFLRSNWWGSHVFKFGVEYMQDTNKTPYLGLGILGSGMPTVPCPTQIPGAILGTTCQVVSTLSNGKPLNAYFYPDNPYKYVDTDSTTGIYANDTWQIKHRLTVNIGLRFDRQNLFSKNGTTPLLQPQAGTPFVVFHNFGPRVNISYDLTGHGASVLKASLGHYFNYPAADYASALNPNAGWVYEYAWTSAGGLTGDSPTTYYQPGDTLGTLQSFTGGSATTTFSPTLKLANTYQASAYYEQQAGPYLVRSGLVYNQLRNIAGSVNSLRPLSAYNVAVPSFYVPNAADVATTTSPTVTLWNICPTPAGTCTVPSGPNIYENLPENSHYYNWETTVNRHKGRWSFMGSFNYTWNYVRNFSSGFGAGSSFTPNQLINTVGCGDTAPCITNGRAQYYNWQSKFDNTIKLPYKFMVSPILRLQSGIPFGRYFSTSGITATGITEPKMNVSGNVLAEPFGTERTPTLALVDFRVEKAQTFKDHYTLKGTFDLYNIFNDNGDQAVTAASGPSFLTPSNITPPRIARLGAQFDF